MPADRRLFFLLARAHRAVQARANAELIAELGVSGAQLGMLYHVAKHPGCKMTDIAELFDLNKSAASSMVQRLERAELLRRDASSRDGRVQRLFVTDKGEAVRVRSLAYVRRMTAEITEGLSAAEVDAVFKFLNAIVDRYGDDPDDHEESEP